MISEFDKYYLYRHIRIDTNKVFYIGIGTTKLKSRFPGKFTEEKALNRNLKAERQILEGNAG